MPGRFDPSAMGRLADHIGELATVPSRASRAAADGINEALAEQFANGTDAYGKPWAGLSERTLRRHGPPPLTDEGDLAEGTHARATAGAGIETVVPFPGGIHQTGSVNGGPLPARKILPEGRELPPAWRDAIDDAVDAAIKKRSAK